MARDIPPILVNYLHHVLSSQVLLTSVLDTPPPPLLAVFLNYAFSHKVGTAQAKSTKVVFLSLLRPLSLWTELSKKQGLDLTALIRSNEFVYVDGLCSSNASNTVVIGDKVDADNVHNVLRRTITQVRSVSTPNTGGPQSNVLLVIDGLDFILASDPKTDALQLHQQLAETRQSVDGLVVTCHADSPLLHTSGSTGTPLEKQHSTFASMLAHQSSLVIQLRPLDSGAAKDVTGVLRISRGGAYEEREESTTTVVDGEWLYHIKSNGNIRIWSRGE